MNTLKTNNFLSLCISILFLLLTSCGAEQGTANSRDEGQTTKEEKTTSQDTPFKSVNNKKDDNSDLNTESGKAEQRPNTSFSAPFSSVDNSPKKAEQPNSALEPKGPLGPSEASGPSRSMGYSGPSGPMGSAKKVEQRNTKQDAPDNVDEPDPQFHIVTNKKADASAKQETPENADEVTPIYTRKGDEDKKSLTNSFESSGNAKAGNNKSGTPKSATFFINEEALKQAQTNKDKVVKKGGIKTKPIKSRSTKKGGSIKSSRVKKTSDN